LKILILVVATHNGPYGEDLRVQENTLGTIKHPDVKVFWVIAGANQAELRNNRLYLPIEEKFGNILMKSVLAIKYLDEKFNPDFIIRSNTSSYFNLIKVKRLCEKLIQNNFDFGGYLETYKVNSEQQGEERFVNGSGIYLARKAINLIKEIDINHYANTPDDVAITLYLKNAGLKATEIKRNNICYHHIFVPRAHSRVKSFNNPSLTRDRMRLIHDFTITKSIVRKIRLWLNIFTNEVRNSNISKANTFYYLKKMGSGGFKP
jgi:hypothetical protein